MKRLRIYWYTKIRDFPVMLFAIVMGLTGYSLVIQKLATIVYIPMGIQDFFAYLAFGVYLLISFLYLNKINLHPKDFYKEVSNPNHIGFIAITSVATTLIATTLLPYSESLSLMAWGIGAIVQIALMVRIVTLWISYQNDTRIHTDPSWFIPAVGCLAIPIAGVKLAPIEISWFFFSVGILFWLVMLPIYFYRNIYHHAFDERLTPSLFILMAPPSVGTIAWHSLTGEIDAFARILYSISLFLFIVAIMQYKLYLNIKSFHLSSWSFSFPLATSILATFTMAIALDSYFLVILGSIKTAGLSLVIILLIWKTVECFAKKATV
ncbi:MAG: C4-dicarboxylate ABC transporter, partial [Thiothrix sp.]